MALQDSDPSDSTCLALCPHITRHRLHPAALHEQWHDLSLASPQGPLLPQQRLKFGFLKFEALSWPWATRANRWWDAGHPSPVTLTPHPKTNLQKENKC